MNIRANLIAICTLSFLLIAQTAHADFRKAVDAYITKDANAILKEVKDAVDKKNDDGLILFLIATNMDANSSSYDQTAKQYNTTLRSILSQEQWKEIRELLVQATNNSTVHSQYLLNVENLQFSRELIIQQLQQEYIKHGVIEKKEYTNQEVNQAYKNAKKDYIEKGVIPFADYSSPEMISKQAESGDAYAQSLLGFFNLGFTRFTVPACEEIKTYASLCKVKNERNGNAWLKKAVMTYEQDGLLNEEYGKFATGMCDFLLTENVTDNNVQQAYLWCFMGANLGDLNALNSLDKLQKSGKLEVLNPKLDAAWNSSRRNNVLLVKNIKNWPDLVIKARSELPSESIPVFSYLLFDRPGTYALNVYTDGRVIIKDMQRTGYKTLYKKISPTLINQFLTEIHQTNIDKWSLFPGWVNCGSCTSSTKYIRISIKEGNSVRRLFLSEAISDNWNFKITQIDALVEKFFPTKQLRLKQENFGQFK